MSIRLNSNPLFSKGLITGLAWLSLLACSLPVFGAVKVQVTADSPTAVYQDEQKVIWKITVTADNGSALPELDYSVKKGGEQEIAAGKVTLTDGKGEVSATRADPGTLLLTIKYKQPDTDKETIVYGGAAFAPDLITPSAPPPDDFDTFWKGKIAELNAVPMNVQLERVDIGDKNIEYYKIMLDNIGGSKIYGQIAKPAGKENLPALLQVQWAGVYPLNKDWVLGYARNGWLAMNISAHDLPIDQPEAFYQAKAGKELNDYPGQGNDDREKSYFLRMFLSCRRAVDYLAERPDWNKQTLVVHGGSQGGYQAIVTAGIHPAVTAMAANVPAGCDHTGKQAGRAPGWPQWASRTWQGKNEQKMLETARYFDAMNFAHRVKCPALVGAGLVDTVCPAEGVFATFNALKGPKEIVLMPQADHGGDHRAYHEKFGRFLEQQKTSNKKK